MADLRGLRLRLARVAERWVSRTDKLLPKLIGNWHWQAPPWIPWTSRRVSESRRYLSADPRRAIAFAIAVALLVVGAIGWRFYWRIVQREANGAIADRSAGSRKAFLFVTMTISLWLAFILVQQLLADFLVRLFDTGLNNYKPWTLLFSIVILLMVWRWHDQVELNDRAANADGTRGSDLRRGYWYVLASFGVFGVISGYQKTTSGLYIIDVKTDTLKGFLPSGQGHHDCVIIPRNKQELLISRCPTT